MAALMLGTALCSTDLSAQQAAGDQVDADDRLDVESFWERRERRAREKREEEERLAARRAASSTAPAPLRDAWQMFYDLGTAIEEAVAPLVEQWTNGEYTQETLSELAFPSLVLDNYGTSESSREEAVQDLYKRVMAQQFPEFLPRLQKYISKINGGSALDQLNEEDWPLLAMTADGLMGTYRRDAMYMILSAGANPDVMYGPEDPPTRRLLSGSSEPEVARILLEHGADPDAPGGVHDETPVLVMASGFYANDGLVRLLLEHGADPHIRHTEEDQSPMMAAIAYRDFSSDLGEGREETNSRRMQIIRLLIDNGTDSKLSWFIELAHAVKHADIEVVKTLLDVETEPGGFNAETSPLFLVSTRFGGESEKTIAIRNEIATLLLDAGAPADRAVESDALFPQRQTPLYSALRAKRPEIATLLLDAGADPLQTTTPRREFACRKRLVTQYTGEPEGAPLEAAIESLMREDGSVERWRCSTGISDLQIIISPKHEIARIKGVGGTHYPFVYIDALGTERTLRFPPHPYACPDLQLTIEGRFGRYYDFTDAEEGERRSPEKIFDCERDDNQP
ncbi:MAG: hypothetical protein OXG29_08095 [Gammaproteobacteria bacterium]|nr:hypothetical protein [Gammaproteobacteria bacterium]